MILHLVKTKPDTFPYPNNTTGGTEFPAHSQHNEQPTALGVSVGAECEIVFSQNAWQANLQHNTGYLLLDKTTDAMHASNGPEKDGSGRKEALFVLLCLRKQEDNGGPSIPPTQALHPILFLN